MSALRKRIVESLAPPLAYAYLRLLQATVRREYRNREALERAEAIGGPQIYAFWHSRLAMARFGYFRDHAVVLQSRHRDSRMLGRVMRRFGIGQVWGSSTRGGMSAARESVRRLRQGWDLAVAPDGPRGPRQRAQAGVITIARLSGAPIVPFGWSARPSRRLRSWDRLLLPFPFGRVLYVYGEPMLVDRRAGAEEQELARERLEAELNRLSDAADAAMGVPCVAPAPAARETDASGGRGERQ